MDSNFTTISYNEIRENRESGLYLGDTVYNSVFKNNIENNNYGIDMSSSHNTTIYGNTIRNNTFEGIYVGDSNFNLIAGNDITLNEKGIMLQANSNNNTVWFNSISNNSEVNGLDEVGDNNWDNGMVGNYWGDYLTRYPLAMSTDNIWNVPYEVNASGGESNVNDSLPLVAVTAMLEIVTWGDFKYGYGQTGNAIPWVIIGSMPLVPQYRIYFDDNLIQEGNWNTEFISFNVDGLEIGTYTYTIVVTDGTVGHEVEDIVHVEVGLLPGKPIFITGSQNVTTMNVTINWGTASNADSYDIYVDDVFITNTEDTGMILAFTTNGTYSIHIVAINEFGESALSDPLQITIELPSETPDDPSNVIYYVLGGAFILIGASAGVFVFIKKKKTS